MQLLEAPRNWPGYLDSSGGGRAVHRTQKTTIMPHNAPLVPGGTRRPMLAPITALEDANCFATWREAPRGTVRLGTLRRVFRSLTIRYAVHETLTPIDK